MPPQDIMGYDVMGDDDDDVDGYDEDDVEGMEVVGYSDSGEPIIVGARKRRRRKRKTKALVAVRSPAWRGRQLAPGVIAPDQGMLPLPLSGRPASTFAAATTAITFEGQVQKPFRGERLLVTTVRTGTSAVGRLISQLFIGTDLQQLDTPGFDAEQVGASEAFGVRLTLKPCQPGVFVRLVTVLSNPLTGTDTIFASVTLLGRAIQ